MARNRNLSPEFWDDPILGTLDSDSRLLFLALMSHADDEGRGEVDARMRKICFGFRASPSVEEVQGLLEELSQRVDGILFYDVDGRRYYDLVGYWDKWQTVQRPRPSTIPTLPLDE